MKKTTIQDLERIPVHILLSEVFPEGLILMRDGGVWGVWEDEDEYPIYEQGDGEPFSLFVKRIISDMMNKEKPDKHNVLGMVYDLAMAEYDYENDRFSEKKYLLGYTPS